MKDKHRNKVSATSWELTGFSLPKILRGYT